MLQKQTCAFSNDCSFVWSAMLSNFQISGDMLFTLKKSGPRIVSMKSFDSS